MENFSPQQDKYGARAFLFLYSMEGKGRIRLNNVCLCVGCYAKTPYLIKNSEINVYSIEELCYYFMENLQILDQDIMAMDLVAWIREECALGEMADELEILVRKNVSVPVFVTTLLERSAIYNESLIKQAERVLKEQSALSPFERWKKKAEQNYQAGKFHQAQMIYTKLLEETSEEDVNIKAALYYNIAAIYAMNFDYDEAAEYYKLSYELVQSKRARIAYILALKQSMSDFDYGVFMRGHEQWQNDFEEVEDMCEAAKGEWQQSKAQEMLKQLEQYKKSGQIQEYQKMRNDLIFQLKKDYRRQTM